MELSLVFEVVDNFQSIYSLTRIRILEITTLSVVNTQFGQFLFIKHCCYFQPLWFMAAIILVNSMKISTSSANIVSNYQTTKEPPFNANELFLLLKN